MSNLLKYKLVNGIKCYSPQMATQYDNYPNNGFDVTDEIENQSFWIRSRNRIFKYIINKYSYQFNSPKLLEIGCGNGEFIKEIIQNKNLIITGSEIYLKGILYAKKKLPNAVFIQHDVTQGKLPCKFDMIAAFDVIEHIENDVEALSNIFQMLNHNGYFIVSVPQYQFLWSRLDEIIKHKRRYSREDLFIKLKQQGFKIDYSTSFIFILFPMMLIFRFIDHFMKEEKSTSRDFEKRITFPILLNRVFDMVMRIDEFLIKIGLSLPFGGTLLVVASK